MSCGDVQEAQLAAREAVDAAKVVLAAAQAEASQVTVKRL
jgi:hypothetical protein